MAEKTTEIRVPFNKPCRLGTELEQIRTAIEGGGQLSGGSGHFSRKCEEGLTKILGRPATLTTSATHALEMCALLLRLKSGDEVILPSYTFVSTANAFVLRGAEIRFAENDSFGNLDLKSCEEAITPRTRAVVVVHYGGNSCEIDKLAELCKSRGIALIEDAAQSIGAEYKGKPLGTFGDLGCISFHDTKNITSGEGGCLIINNPEFLERAEILREKGTNRAQFFQGLVDKYSWVDIGSSYILSELNAAYLYPQLQGLEKITDQRRTLCSRYEKALRPGLEKSGYQLVDTPPGNRSNGHVFAFLFRNPDERPKFIQFMKSRGVTTPFHYVALHTSVYGKKFLTDHEGPFRNCMKFSDQLIRLPVFYNLTEDEQGFVVQCVEDWLKQNH